jgi:hypothetical protein
MVSTMFFTTGKTNVRPTPFIRWVAALIPLSLFIVPILASIDLTTCNTIVADLISGNASLATDSSLFAIIPADPQNLVLTLEGCNTWCAGGDRSISPQCGLRLFQWVLPAVLLVGSIQAPPTHWRKRLWAMVRPVANPLGCLFSMLHVLRVAAFCHSEADVLVGHVFANRLDDGQDRKSRTVAQRFRAFWSNEPLTDRQRVVKSVALILNGLRDLDNAGEGVWSIRVRLQSSFSQPNLSRESRLSLIRTTAARMAENRSRDTWKAYGAVFFSIANIVFAMIPPAAPGSTPPSGATIASTLTLSPLFLVVLLSNSIGEKKSFYTLHKIATHLLDELDKPWKEERDAEGGGEAWRMVQYSLTRLRDTIGRPYAEDHTQLLYTSGSLCYQPRRRMTHIEETRRQGLLDSILQFLFILVVPLSAAGAAGALAGPPSYFNDRCWVVISIGVLWVLQPIVRRLVPGFCRIYGRYDRVQYNVWRVTACLDVFLASAIVVLLASITCGVGGTCRNWAGVYRYGENKAQVPLNTAAAFAWNGTTLYPALVSACVGLNVGAYFGVRYLAYLRKILRPALNVICWLGNTYRGSTKDAYEVLAWRDDEIAGALEDEESGRISLVPTTADNEQ